MHSSMGALGAPRIKQSYEHSAEIISLHLMIMQRNRVYSLVVEYLGESQRTKLALNTESNILEVLCAG